MKRIISGAEDECTHTSSEVEQVGCILSGVGGGKMFIFVYIHVSTEESLVNLYTVIQWVSILSCHLMPPHVICVGGAWRACVVHYGTCMMIELYIIQCAPLMYSTDDSVPGAPDLVQTSDGCLAG